MYVMYVYIYMNIYIYIYIELALALGRRDEIDVETVEGLEAWVWGFRFWVWGVWILRMFRVLRSRI